MNDAPLHSTSNAIAGSPRGALEALPGILERSWPARRVLCLTIWRGLGRHEICDALEGLVRDVVRELGAERAIRFRVRSWPFFWFPVFFKGARHFPVLQIAGSVYSQGMVPGKEGLKKHTQSLLV